MSVIQEYHDSYQTLIREVFDIYLDTQVLHATNLANMTVSTLRNLESAKFQDIFEILSENKDQEEIRLALKLFQQDLIDSPIDPFYPPADLLERLDMRDKSRSEIISSLESIIVPGYEQNAEFTLGVMRLITLAAMLEE